MKRFKAITSLISQMHLIDFVRTGINKGRRSKQVGQLCYGIIVFARRFLNRHYKNNLRQIFSEYLLLDTNGEELSQMLKHILDNGFSVIGVQRTGMHLEEYYMKKVGKD